MAALDEAGVPYEIVPGVSAAFAAAAALGRSLTDRDWASTSSSPPAITRSRTTTRRCPRSKMHARRLHAGPRPHAAAAEWLAEGLPPDFPCAVVSPRRARSPRS
jgi:precorrin-4 methylase